MRDKEMRDEDRPYLCLRNGWMVQITPRNRAGWLGMLAWLAVLVVPTGLFVWLASTEPDPGTMAAATAGFLVVIAGWAVAMIRWMMARSVVVDAGDIERYKRDAKRRRRD